MGVVQIDSVNVLVRSQELPLFSRLGDHPRTLIPDATAAGELFEYWCHEASHLPVDMLPLLRWRMEAARKGETWGGLQRVVKKHPGLVNEIRDRVTAEGAIVAGDVRTRTGPKGSWWDWDEGKAVLEYLFWTGEITARRRANDFARIYMPWDALPGHLHGAPPIDETEARRELLRRAARSCGIATAADLFDYHRQKATVARPILADMVAAGELEQVRVEGWREPAYLSPSAVRPRTLDAAALVSPFDSLVWCRPRNERLFGFHYRIEIYTPAPKRVYGYYVLPFVMGDRIVARVDLKADRKEGALLVNGAYSEEGTDPRAVAASLRDELGTMAKWLGLADVRVADRGDLSSLLAPKGRRRRPT